MAHEVSKIGTDDANHEEAQQGIDTDNRARGGCNDQGDAIWYSDYHNETQGVRDNESEAMG